MEWMQQAPYKVPSFYPHDNSTQPSPILLPQMVANISHSNAQGLPPSKY